MANTVQAKKRAIQSENNRQRNVGKRSMLRTHVKNVVKAITKGDKIKAQTAYEAAVPIIDKMANKGLIHKNKAARHKSRLNARIRALPA